MPTLSTAQAGVTPKWPLPKNGPMLPASRNLREGGHKACINQGYRDAHLPCMWYGCMHAALLEAGHQLAWQYNPCASCTAARPPPPYPLPILQFSPSFLTSARAIQLGVQSNAKAPAGSSWRRLQPGCPGRAMSPALSPSRQCSCVQGKSKRPKPGSWSTAPTTACQRISGRS